MWSVCLDTMGNLISFKQMYMSWHFEHAFQPLLISIALVCKCCADKKQIQHNIQVLPLYPTYTFVYWVWTVAPSQMKKVLSQQTILHLLFNKIWKNEWTNRRDEALSTYKIVDVICYCASLFKMLYKTNLFFLVNDSIKQILFLYKFHSNTHTF